jgi:hypothetical protein
MTPGSPGSRRRDRSGFMMLFHFLASVIGVEAGAGPRDVRYTMKAPSRTRCQTAARVRPACSATPDRVGSPVTSAFPSRRAMSSGARRTQISDDVRVGPSTAPHMGPDPDGGQALVKAPRRGRSGTNPSLRSCRFVGATGQPVGIPRTRRIEATRSFSANRIKRTACKTNG